MAIVPVAVLPDPSVSNIELQHQEELSKFNGTAENFTRPIGKKIFLTVTKWVLKSNNMVTSLYKVI